MKKWLPALLCFVFLIGIVPVIVFAQTPVIGRATSTDPSDTTSTTQGEDLRFDFEYQDDNQAILIKWNAEDANDRFVKHVKIGDKSKGVNNDTSGEFEVDLLNDLQLYPGIYPISLLFDNNEEITIGKNVEVAGELQININLSESDGFIAATVMDEHGRPVDECEVELFIAGQSYKDEIGVHYTDQDGYVRFYVRLPEDKTKVKCKVDDFSVDLPGIDDMISYIGAEGTFPDNPPSTTTSSSTTTTKNTTTANNKTRPKTQTTPKITKTVPTTRKTLPIIVGAGTTAVFSDKIAVNVSFDTGVIDKFNCSSKDFSARSRLLMSKTLYSDIIGSSNATAMLLAQTSAMDITDQLISAAISGKSRYSLFQAEQTLRIPLDLSLLVVDSTLQVNTPVTMPESDVQIEMPIPKSMRKASKYTVVAAICDKNSITQFLDTKVEDGIMRFNTNRLSTVAILGFDNQMGSNINKNSIPYLAIGIIVLGLLMLAGAGTLLYFFFIRKPAYSDGAGESSSFEPENMPGVQEDGVSLSSLLNRDHQDNSSER